MEDLKQEDLQNIVDDVVESTKHSASMLDSYDSLMAMIPVNLQESIKNFLFHEPYMDFFKSVAIFVTDDNSIQNMTNPEDFVYHMFQIVDETKVEFLVAEVAVLAHLFVSSIKITMSEKYSPEARKAAKEILDESNVDILNYHIRNLIEISKSEDSVSKNDQDITTEDGERLQ